MSAKETRQYADTHKDVLNKAIKDNAEIIIHRNKECGDILYSVSLVSDEGYWLDSFSYLDNAIEFCTRRGLVITDYISDKDTEEGG